MICCCGLTASVPPNKPVQIAGAVVLEEAIDMSASAAQYNGEDAGRPLASRPLLTGISVRRLQKENR
jgi:hypothetical protein